MVDKGYMKKVLTRNEVLMSVINYHWMYFFNFKNILFHILPLVLFSIFIGMAFFIQWPYTVIPFLLVTGGSFLCLLLYKFITSAITSSVRFVTNRRVVVKRGFLSRSTDELKLSAIEAITFNESFIERILGVGTLHIEGRGGGTEIDLKYVIRPLKVKNVIESIEWSE